MLGATQSACGGGCGSLLDLPPVSGGWIYKQVHVFGQGTDGYHPTGDLIFDSAGIFTEPPKQAEPREREWCLRSCTS